MLELGYKSPLLLFYFILHRHLFSIFPVILTEFSSRARNRYPRKYRVILSLSSQTPRYPRKHRDVHCLSYKCLSCLLITIATAKRQTIVTVLTFLSHVNCQTALSTVDQ